MEIQIGKYIDRYIDIKTEKKGTQEWISRVQKLAPIINNLLICLHETKGTQRTIDYMIRCIQVIKTM